MSCSGPEIKAPDTRALQAAEYRPESCHAGKGRDPRDSRVERLGAGGR